MDKNKVYEKMVKNAKTAANQAACEANRKIKVMKQICRNSENYDVIEEMVSRINQLEGLKNQVRLETPEDVTQMHRLGYLFTTIKEIENF